MGRSEMDGKTSKAASIKEKATPEQLRLAQYLSDSQKEDPFLIEKVKQVTEVTGKTEDEAFLALHDCNNDLTKAINLLIEEKSDQWSTIDKKKKALKKLKTPAQDEKVITPPKCQSPATTVKGRPARVFYNSNLNRLTQSKDVNNESPSHRIGVTMDWSNYSARLKGNLEDLDQDYTGSVLETHVFTPTRSNLNSVGSENGHIADNTLSPDLNSIVKE